MKWDVKLPGWDDTIRLEVRARQEGDRWGAYICLAFSTHEHLCWLVGEQGMPFRFEGSTQEKVQKQAKDYLEEQYKVIRKIWS